MKENEQSNVKLHVKICGKRGQMYINDIDISHVTSSFTISKNGGHRPHVTIDIFPHETDIDIEGLLCENCEYSFVESLG